MYTISAFQHVEHGQLYIRAKAVSCCRCKLLFTSVTVSQISYSNPSHKMQQISPRVGS